MSGVKYLRPPLRWSTDVRQVIEDQKFKRWTIDQVRAMKNGRYDWSKHEDKPV